MQTADCQILPLAAMASHLVEKRFLLLDSRKLVDGKESIFFAMKGQHHNGHQFLAELYAKGVRDFVVEELPTTAMPEACCYPVYSSVESLQWLASLHRQRFRIPVLGITGSNGKTIVKEWLSQLLEGEVRLVKSPKSYNSQIGVPLSVWEMRPGHELAVLEAGISQPGEMAKLAQVMRPTIGIFTNIGSAHQEHFESLQQKVEEKMLLFSEVETLIYCADHQLIHEAAQKLSCQKFIWGTAEHCDIRVAYFDEGRRCELTYKNEWITLHLPFSDKASVENIMHCVAFLLYWGMPSAKLQGKISRLHNLPMRLELKNGIGNCLLIDDTYNNDVAGLAVALDFMDQQDQRRKRTAILSDFVEGSAHSYREAQALLASKGVARLIGIGSDIVSHAAEFSMEECAFFPSADALLEAFSLGKLALANETVLIKGSRVFALEKVAKALQQRIHGTRLEIDLEALLHNLNFYRSLLKPTTKVMAMVKAFAYGSGSYEVASLLQYHRADYLAVAYPDEGVALRAQGITLPIMVMNPSPEAFPVLMDAKLEPEIYSLRLLRAYLDFLAQYPQGQSMPIHIKFDTGMHRLGFDASEMPQLLRLLQAVPWLKVASAFTHLAASDDFAHKAFTEGQLSAFASLAHTLEEALGYRVLKHALNSSGIVNYAEAQFDMVRLGIGLYGVESGERFQGHLRTVGTLKTTISQIREIAAAETVGYGRKGRVARPSRIGVMAIGYADGFDRRFSNGVGEVCVNGKLAPVVGNVCMDMTMIDLTGIDAQEGDEVIIFGENPHIIDLAKRISIIPYEILTNVNERVKRVFYQ